LNPPAQQAEIYRPGQPPEVLTAPDELNGEQSYPTWSYPEEWEFNKVWTAVSAVQEQARCLPDKTWI